MFSGSCLAAGLTCQGRRLILRCRKCVKYGPKLSDPPVPQLGLIFTENAIFTTCVKKQETIKIKGPFEAEALRILRAVPRLNVLAEPARRAHGADATVLFGENRTIVAVEFKQRVNAATAWQLVHQAQARVDRPLLLIAGTTTAKARHLLEKHGIAVIDGLGNVHIELPGLFFHVEGRGRKHGPKPSPARLRGKAGLVVQALLLARDRPWQVSDLAEEAGVSVALAHRVLTRLEGEGVLVPEHAGPRRVRRLTNPTALLDLWAEEDLERPNRTPAYLLAQSPQKLIRQLGANLAEGHIDYALTGAAAAALVAPFVTAVPVVQVWATATAAPDDLIQAAGADPVTDGPNVVFLQGKDDAPLAFRERVDGLWVVNRFRLYVDLQKDPRRGAEQADHLRREVIGF